MPHLRCTEIIAAGAPDLKSIPARPIGRQFIYRCHPRRMLPSVIRGPGGCLLAISERHRRAEYIAAALSTATCTTN
jgi:hypothetical protein